MEVIYLVTGKAGIYSQGTGLGNASQWYMTFSAGVRP